MGFGLMIYGLAHHEKWVDTGWIIFATSCPYPGLVLAANYLGYIVAQLSAGTLAPFVFKVLSPEDK